MGRLNEKEVEEKAAVNRTLNIVENLLEIKATIASVRVAHAHTHTYQHTPTDTYTRTLNTFTPTHNTNIHRSINRTQQTVHANLGQSITEKTDLLKWLVARIKAPVMDENKVYVLDKHPVTITYGLSLLLSYRAH